MLENGHNTTAIQSIPRLFKVPLFIENRRLYLNISKQCPVVLLDQVTLPVARNDNVPTIIVLKVQYLQ